MVGWVWWPLKSVHQQNVAQKNEFDATFNEAQKMMEFLFCLFVINWIYPCAIHLMALHLRLILAYFTPQHNTSITWMKGKKVGNEISGAQVALLNEILNLKEKKQEM